MCRCGMRVSARDAAQAVFRESARASGTPDAATAGADGDPDTGIQRAVAEVETDAMRVRRLATLRGTPIVFHSWPEPGPTPIMSVVPRVSGSTPWADAASVDPGTASTGDPARAGDERRSDRELYEPKQLEPADDEGWDIFDWLAGD
jgi:hypothetical protein